MSKKATDLTPLSTIRSETVISKLPLHNLAKTKRINLQVTKKNEQGEIYLHWEVSANEKYGLPNQLAYKLDTIIINKRIDELGRPLPKVIRLGSLKQICKDLGLSISGRTFAKVREAFLQNALAGITALLKYKGIDGVERLLEAGFTRYSVVFTGERLPDGAEADAVYLVLNDLYWEVLNNAPFRPLDYDYLKELTPAAQRFYEILSYRMFVANKYGHKYAQLLYSSFCTFSAQNRYYDYQHFRKQMYKIHKPHLASGYIEKVEYEATKDEDGKADWQMRYIPGPKAKAEYRAFNGKYIDEDQIFELSTETRKEKKKTSKKRPISRLAGSDFTLDDEAYFLAQVEKTEKPVLELIQYFHELARNEANYKPLPGSKEIKHAEAILKAYGLEKAKYIIGFAVEEAKKTNFVMRNFGAIRQYVNEAISRYERQNAERERIEQHEARQRQEEEQYINSDLQRLTPEQYQIVYQEAKDQIFSALPQLAVHQNEAGFQIFIKREMVSMLDRQENKRN